MKLKVPRILLGAMVACLVAQMGCVRSTNPSAAQSSEPSPRRALSVQDAAVLAAQLANEQAERQYRRRPFNPAQYAATFQDGVYHWGKLDVSGRTTTGR